MSAMDATDTMLCPQSRLAKTAKKHTVEVVAELADFCSDVDLGALDRLFSLLGCASAPPAPTWPPASPTEVHLVRACAELWHLLAVEPLWKQPPYQFPFFFFPPGWLPGRFSPGCRVADERPAGSPQGYLEVAVPHPRLAPLARAAIMGGESSSQGEPAPGAC